MPHPAIIAATAAITTIAVTPAAGTTRLASFQPPTATAADAATIASASATAAAVPVASTTVAVADSPAITTTETSTFATTAFTKLPWPLRG